MSGRNLPEPLIANVAAPAMSMPLMPIRDARGPPRREITATAQYDAHVAASKKQLDESAGLRLAVRSARKGMPTY